MYIEPIDLHRSTTVRSRCLNHTAISVLRFGGGERDLQICFDKMEKTVVTTGKLLTGKLPLVAVRSMALGEFVTSKKLACGRDGKRDEREK